MSGTAYPGTAPRGGAFPPGAGPAAWGPSPGRWDPWSLPKPWLIAAIVVGFILFWPVGLALLFFAIGSGRIGGGWARRHGFQSGGPGGSANGAPRMSGCGWQGWRREETASSGNHAFDEYRQETLRRLEEEQRDFAAFLERLRFAKDKAEFDQFMTERRQRPPAPPPATPQDGNPAA